MVKEFKTISEQIDLLKSRGLVFTDEKKAAQYLLTNNYYSIINGYSKPFLASESPDRYLPGTNFDEICHLYLFDKQIKQIFFDSILDAEHHIKSLLAYRFAEHTQGTKYVYLDVSNFDHTKSAEIAYVINQIEKIIKQNKHYSNNAIYHYYHSYHQVPIWVLTGFLSFGDTVALLNILPRRIRNQLAVDCLSFLKDNQPALKGNFDRDTMSSFLKNINEVRNICAHNKRLIYFRCHRACTNFSPLFEHYNSSQRVDRTSPFSVFLTMQCFISKMEYAQLNNTIRKKSNFLQNHLSTISINKIFHLLGFPKNWNKQSILPQAE